MSQPSLQSTLESERYEVVLPLAKGGMGTVELVVRRTEGFERLYALKRLHPHLREDDELVKMFLDEARLGGLVRHANVVSVLDVGRDLQGPYFVMEYIEGRSLRDVLKTVIRSERRIPVQVCVRIAAQVAAGLHAAHELRDGAGRALNLVHRDVSPQNIIVGFDGVSRLTDFGIAKVWGASTQTRTGVLKGKKGYTSPEQLRLERVDRRSDLFSLGIVLFETLSGRRLYSGDYDTVIQSILYDPPPDIGELRRDIPSALSELLFRLLAKDREHRPPLAAEVVDSLQDVLADLIAEEGAVTVADFMQETFSGARDDDHAKIRVGMDEMVRVQQKASHLPNASRRRLVIGVGIAAVSLALGVALTVAVVGGREPLAQQAPAPSVTVAAPPPPVAVTEEPATAAPATQAEESAAANSAPPASMLAGAHTTKRRGGAKGRGHRRRPPRSGSGVSPSAMSPSAMSGSPSPWMWPGR
ncbi:MAG: serine/threonine protein kinase [Deltaproteobacteria bacterium]|nr:serine/threonine protein kinase [Deltaproteobacteria bacterium]